MEKVKKKRSRKKKDITQEVIDLLNSKNKTLSENTKIPIYYRDYVYYYCNFHKEFGEQRIREDDIKRSKFCCKKCKAEYMSKLLSGENSPSWKGGVSSIRSKIRYALNGWVSLTLKAYDYTCYLTGRKDNLEVHHMYGFNIIIDDIAKDLNIDINNNVSSISKEKLKQLEEKVVQYHLENDIGVVLNSEIHEEFHRMYGLGNNTPEQFYEFCETFNKMIVDIDLQNFSIKNLKLPKTKNFTSDYVGVIRSKDGKWESSIVYYGKQLHIGRFNTEYRAVKAYNEKALELFGDSARLNDMSELKDHWVYEDSYYRFKKGGSSMYTGVYYSNNGWRYEIWEDDTGKISRGSAKTELQACYLYNQKKKELLGEDSIINFLTFEEEEQAKKSLEFKYEYYEHKTNGKSIYTNVFPSGKKWGARVRVDGSLIVIGNTFLSDKEAGIAYNNYIIENKLKKKLNYIV